MAARRLYFDWNASAPLRPEAAEAMARASSLAGNPSSVHEEGRALRALVEESRARVRRALDAEGARVVFTSGATESDNLAILGSAAAAERAGRPRSLVTTLVDHPAVAEPARLLAKRGWKVEWVRPDGSGRVDPGDVLEAARDASLVSVILASNEIGTVQDVAALARRGPFVLHTDATQAPGRIPLSFRSLGCDLLSLSGHKFGGPRGTGVLVARAEGLLEPLFLGGGQEFGMRPGTENVAGIVGFAEALDCAASERAEAARRWGVLRSVLRSELSARIPGVRFVTPEQDSLPNTLLLVIPGVDGRALVAALDLEGVSASVGSACASGSIEPSRALLALGLSPEEARAGLRLSWGSPLGREDVLDIVERIARVVLRLRAATLEPRARVVGTSEPPRSS